MACPFFLPTERLQSQPWPHPARLPLGDAWDGLCTAPAAAGLSSTPNSSHPTGDELKHGCNLGYARSCPRLPAERHADAVRLCVVRDSAKDHDSAQASVKTKTQRIRVEFVLEIAHAPGEHGTLEYDPGSRTWLARHPDARLQRMAECHLESYLLRRGR